MTPRPEATPRRGMNATRRARIIAAQDGKCAGCSRPGPFDVDHRLTLWMSGPDEDHNCEALCILCHKRKTKADKSAIAKVKRIHARIDGTRRLRRPIPSRGFAKGHRPIPSRPFSKRAP